MNGGVFLTKTLPLVSRDTSDNYGQAAWALLFYALWHRRHILGTESAGGAFDVLGG